MPVIKGTFTLEFQDNGKSKLTFIPEDQKEGIKFTNMPVNSGNFSGLSSNPYFEIKIDKIYLTNVHFGAEVGKPLGLKLMFDIFSSIRIEYIPMKPDDRVEFRRGLTNLLFVGTETVQQGLTRVYGRTTWQLAGKAVILEQLSNYEDITKHLTEFKDVGVTCELKTDGTYNELSSINEIAENLQNLFSLAAANYITTLYEDVYINGQLSASILFPLKTYIFSNRPSLIDTSIFGNREFKDFIDTTYQNYVTLRVSLGLPYFTEFYTTSKMYSPLEVEYILATTAFECLESYFRGWQGLPEASGGLKGKITRMCNHFGFTATDAELEPYRLCRNSLTHEGKFPAGSDSIASIMELRNLIDRFVLTILGYRNKPYYNVVKRAKDMAP